jgi:hypothetical protein
MPQHLDDGSSFVVAPQTVPAVQYATFRVSDYLGWQEDGSLELRPHFQRGAVWDQSDRSLLIDSILHGFPIPLVVLQEEWDVATNRMRKRVIDGQQRIRTLLSFTRPELLHDREESDDFLYRPTGQKSGLAFRDLSEGEQRRIISSSLSAVLVASDASDPFILEIYERLNTTGKRLTGQELRYARRDGDFAELAYRLARANQSRWTDWKIMSPRDIGRMLDVQLTSELMLLMLDGIQKTGKREIDAAYSGVSRSTASDDSSTTGRKLTTADRNYVQSVFQAIMDRLDAAYAYPPERLDPVRFLRSRGWFYSFFSYALHRGGFINLDGDRTSGTTLKSGLAAISSFDPSEASEEAAAAYGDSLKSNTELAKAVSGAASDRRARLARFQFIASTVRTRS